MRRLITVTIFIPILVLTACQIAVSRSDEATSPKESLAVVEATAAPTSPPKEEADAEGDGSGADTENASSTAESITTEQTATEQTGSEQAADAPSSEAALEIGDDHPAQSLIASFVEPSQTNGELLVLFGQVVDVNETPLPNTRVEIWQTDASGVYDHPQDPNTSTRDMTFQFYGTTTTNEEGWYVFRTIVPGLYEPRPRHIHFKAKQNDSTLLTSQFYFSDDIADVQEERMFRAVEDSGDLLLLQLVQGEGQLLANGRIVLDTGIGSGALALTPSQAEGPYYPVVDLVSADNDLARLP